MRIINKVPVHPTVHQFRYICEDCALDKVSRVQFPATFDANQIMAGVYDTTATMYRKIRDGLHCKHPNEITYKTFDQSMLEQ